jgi:four helix bundle protein
LSVQPVATFVRLPAVRQVPGTDSLSHSHVKRLLHHREFYKLALASLQFIFNSANLKLMIMFDFQKLDVYQKSKNLCKEIYSILDEKNFDRVTNDQLRRASFSIMLNIAEGTSRFSNKDRKNFFVTARGSAFECVAILEYLHETEEITLQVSWRVSKDLKKSQKCCLD